MEGLKLVAPQAAAWAMDSKLVKVSCKSAMRTDVEVYSGRYILMDFVYVSREGCRPGEVNMRTWSFGSSDPVLRAGPVATAVTGSSPLPKKFSDANFVIKQMRAREMVYPVPLLELSRVYGKPLWFTLNPKPTVYFADGIRGTYIRKTRLSALASQRDNTVEKTSWKQAVAVVKRDLKAWGITRPFLSRLRGTGRHQIGVDRDLSITAWELSITAGTEEEPVAIYFVVAHGDVALWARESPPRDRSHIKSLSSWSLSGVGLKIVKDKKIADFLVKNRKVQVELTVDTAGMKAGKAKYRIMRQGLRQGIEVIFDRRGKVKSVTP